MMMMITPFCRGKNYAPINACCKPPKQARVRNCGYICISEVLPSLPTHPAPTWDSKRNYNSQEAPGYSSIDVGLCRCEACREL